MLNLEDQYDRIFKYLYFRLHDRHLAEDLTQEAFLRFLGSRTYRDENRQLRYLYTIARNLCSRYGKKELYGLKLAAGFTWVLAAALLVFLAVLIPYTCIFGMEGTGEMLQLVKPMSMLPCSIGHMLAFTLGSICLPRYCMGL